MTKTDVFPKNDVRKVGDVLSPEVVAVLTGEAQEEKPPVQNVPQESRQETEEQLRKQIEELQAKAKLLEEQSKKVEVKPESPEVIACRQKLQEVKEVFDSFLNKANLDITEAISNDVSNLAGHISRQKAEYEKKQRQLADIKRQIRNFYTGQNCLGNKPAPEVAKALAKEYNLIIEEVVQEVEEGLKETPKANNSNTPKVSSETWQLNLPTGKVETFDARIKLMKRLYELLEGTTLNFKASDFLRKYGIPQTGGHILNVNGKQYQFFKTTA